MTIQSIFILEGTSGDVILEKHYKGVTSRASVEVFWEEVSKRTKRDDVPPILITSKYYLVNIYRGGLYFLATLTGDALALSVVEFLHRLYDIMGDYFGEVSARELMSNFSTAYQLLDETLDNGHPLVTEPNALHTLIAPPSITSRLTNFVTGKASNVSETIGEAAMSIIPWRKAGVKYAQNECTFDINEEIDCLYESNGSLVSSDIRGSIICNSHMSGMPDLTLHLTTPGVIEDCAFHPCVRYARWEREQVVSFVPPDGAFTLMTYRVSPDRAAPSSPVFCRPMISWREGGSARASFTLGLKPLAAALGWSGSGGVAMGSLSSSSSSSSSSSGLSSPPAGSRNSMSAASIGNALGIGPGATLMGPNGEVPVEDVQLVISFPKAVKTVDLSSEDGHVSVDPRSNVVTWTLGRFPRDKSPELSGTLHLAPGAPAPIESPHAVLKYTLSGQTGSNIGIRDLTMTAELYKFYKAVKSSLRAGRVHFRT